MLEKRMGEAAGEKGVAAYCKAAASALIRRIERARRPQRRPCDGLLGRWAIEPIGASAFWSTA
jgi:hypothetical protein